MLRKTVVAMVMLDRSFYSRYLAPASGTFVKSVSMELHPSEITSLSSSSSPAQSVENLRVNFPPERCQSHERLDCCTNESNRLMPHHKSRSLSIADAHITVPREVCII